jgi:hypothetical protein
LALGGPAPGRVHKIAGRLIETFAEFGTSERINVAGREDAYKIVQIKGFSSLLWADLELVELRECATTDTFCLDIAIRVRLLDASSRDLLYEKLFVHSSAGAAWGSSTWKSLSQIAGSHPLVSESSECRNLDDYCGEAGRKVMETEFSKAINATVAAIATDFRSMIAKP